MFKNYKLKNGLDVILAPLPETKVVTILVFFGIGSRYESDRIAGLSHFVEHMLFNGTKKGQPPKSLQRKLILWELYLMLSHLKNLPVTILRLMRNI